MPTLDDLPQASGPLPFAYTPESLTYIATHVIFPPLTPDESDYTPENACSLARGVCAAAHAYTTHIRGTSEEVQWHRTSKMLDNLQASVQSESCIISQLQDMQTGDILTYFIQPQNAAIILEKGGNGILCEAFEVSPSKDDIRNIEDPLVRSYPESAVEIPIGLFDHTEFQTELATFFSSGSLIGLPSTLPPPAHPQYMSSILHRICRAAGLSDISGEVGCATEAVFRITKHIRDRAGSGSETPWRRSPLWTVIRVTIQMSLEHNDRASYKQFMLFFICILSSDQNNTRLSTHLLHSIPYQLLRRLRRLGPSATDWLSEMVQESCNDVRKLLDIRWTEMDSRSSPFRNPPQDDLVEATDLSLLDCREYIQNTLENPFPESVRTSFCPSHHRRGTLEEFLSSGGFTFDEVDADHAITLYDVERSVEEGIDDWVANVTDVNDACARLEILMDGYISTKRGGLESDSVKLLTGLEMHVALDKLVVKEIPILADYSPEIPVALLEGLLLDKRTSLHRLSCILQYLSARHSHSRQGWSVFSEELTNDSFQVRYYDKFVQAQALVEEDMEVESDTGYDTKQLPVEGPKVSGSLSEKVVAFEEQCIPCFCIWRSAVARILHHFRSSYKALLGEGGYSLIAPVQRQPPPGQALMWQIHRAYFYPDHSRNDPKLCHIIQYRHDLEIWQPSRMHLMLVDVHEHKFQPEHLLAYTHHTSHTSNDVMAALVNCPGDFTLDEFIAFAHLREGGSLQWFNVLQALRTRSPSLRRPHVYFLLYFVASQVGPLNLNTGAWTWHQKLQDSSFCTSLLDELHSLLVDIETGSIDEVAMSTTSMLLARVLASSPSRDVTDKAIVLLRNIRRRTFKWLQELSYNLVLAPTSEERRDLLLDMAATCASTFDTDPITHPRLLKSAEDMDALLSCIFFIRALPFSFRSLDVDGMYVRLLLLRNQRLFFAIEGTLRDAILADPSGRGIDLAVGRIFATYQPGPWRWEQLRHPNACWLTCQTKTNEHHAQQTVHINLLDGTLRADGQDLGGLPQQIWRSPELQQIFSGQGFFIIPSDLPGMDFTTFSETSDHKVHFSLQDDDLVVRAQCSRTRVILALIPSSKLWQDLPPALVHDHVAWLNISKKTIEIRPLSRIWGESSENWEIDCSSQRYHMRKGREALVDIRSSTWAMVSECFECLNDFVRYEPDDELDPYWAHQGSNLLITTSPIVDSSESGSSVLRLSITLPRYCLSFYVNDAGELESRDFKGMVYDEDQSVGTLLGLRNLLVLRQKRCITGTFVSEALIHRCVLIPHGRLTTQDHDDCWVRIFILKGNTNELSYHTYHVDTELGRLMGTNESMESMVFLAALHFVTNWHRPDPLTGQTGVQAALCLLQSGGCLSIMKVKCKSIMSSIFQIFHRTRYPEITVAFEEMYDSYYWHGGRPFPLDSEDVDLEEDQQGLPSFPLDTMEQTSTEGHEHELDDFTMLPPSISSLLQTFSAGSYTRLALDQLIFDRQAPELPNRCILPRNSHLTIMNDVPALNRLFSSLRPHSSFQQEYHAWLVASAHWEYCRTESRTIQVQSIARENHVNILTEHYVKCRNNYICALDMLEKGLGPTADPYEQELHRFHEWPAITADVLLRYLATVCPVVIPSEWKTCLTSFALLLLDLQRARRLLRFTLDGSEEELVKELENEGCEGWNAEDYPDWLVIQIQGNFLIRRTQAETAMELMSPKSKRNTVLQVNMGEGKSSVIIPIVAAALADGKQLVRVIVPKSLTTQMFDLLVARLGGLAGRPIYHLPFSRNPEYDDNDVISLQIDGLRYLMSQCMAERGIVLVQPEHIASLKLMGIEEQIRGQGSRHIAKQTTNYPGSFYKPLMAVLSLKLWGSFVGNMFRSSGVSLDGTRPIQHDSLGSNTGEAPSSACKWQNLQEWLHSHARDILDESDEILHARFQLIYTLGHQQYVDGYPNRWTVTQQVLRLVRRNIYSLAQYAPSAILCERERPGSFPHVRILQSSEVGPRLMSLVTENVMAGELPNFDFRDVDPALHSAIRSFISHHDILRIPETAKRVETYAKGSDQSHLWGGLLLLRGLLTSDILLFALTERRWRVDYGLVPQAQSSTMLAVPYRAKDMPAPDTQFGHPDLTIILTCLSYYYSGLTEKQLRVAFEILQDQDNSSAEYATWLEEYALATVPDAVRKLKLKDINLRTSEQWDKVVFPFFFRNQSVIDFYLSRVVFPKEAKEFPWKLSVSNWDLAEKRENLTTGFSGTNDGRWLLPMSITQRDLDHQKGTNARVLAYLLQPENEHYMVTHGSDEHWSTKTFLQMVARQQPEIRVLLDVGSQILDLSNREVAAAWLEISRETAGAVYFDEKDELMVLTRSGMTTTLSSSAFSGQLGRCVIYLDHAHTRGTDLKLPIGSRAAVTLGSKVTKDALVQGCMRMRKLGHGHSVMFFAPPEIDRSIRCAVEKADSSAPVTTVDILCWTIYETWAEIHQRAPYWAQRGMNHKSRYEAWSEFASGKITKEKLADAWIQSERKSLADLYSPFQTENTSSDLSTLDPEIRQRCKDLGVTSLPDAQMDEEQEREVHRERERERDVELPPKAEPAEHYLHPDVISFVKTGDLPPLHSGSAFLPVFTTLERSTAATRDADVWSSRILATKDFCTTIKPESTVGTMDQYLRPVQWILSRTKDHDKLLVILSPFEVDRLMDDIWASKFVHLHLYAPRTAERMKPSDDLKFCTIPPLPSDWTPPWHLIDQLNIFAGQLYLRDYQAYLRLCHFLDVPTEESKNCTGIRRNMFNIPGSFEEMEIRFSGSPLPFVMALLAIRTRGRPFEHTHMGRILQGQVLTEKDFEKPVAT